MSDLRLFGYVTRLVVEVDGEEVDATAALDAGAGALHIAELGRIIGAHRAANPPQMRPLPGSIGLTIQRPQLPGGGGQVCS